MDYWSKQTDKPLFQNIEWNKPERRDQAGKLIIVGGSRQALASPAESFEIVLKEGIGQAIIALPDKVKGLVGSTLPDALFLPSTTTGEFNKDGETELLEFALHSNAILMPGDVGRNSQTTIFLEQVIQKYLDTLVITRDVLDVVTHSNILLNRPNTVIVATLAQLQKLIKEAGEDTAITFTMDLVKLIEMLHLISNIYEASIITFHQGQLIVTNKGRVSTTKIPLGEEPEHWRLKTASLAACYLVWNPGKFFEALTNAVFNFKQQLEKN